jgi:hypothetical protein
LKGNLTGCGVKGHEFVFYVLIAHDVAGVRIDAAGVDNGAGWTLEYDGSARGILARRPKHHGEIIGRALGDAVAMRIGGIVEPVVGAQDAPRCSENDECRDDRFHGDCPDKD